MAEAGLPVPDEAVRSVPTRRHESAALPWQPQESYVVAQEIVDHAERPDAVLPTLGGQTALNLAMELVDRKAVGVPGTPELIGANAEAIATAEDRERFKVAMQGIGLNVPPSATAHTMDEAMAAVDRIGLPVVIRPAYILGGRGTGIAATPAEFERVAATGLAASPISEILIERSIVARSGFSSTTRWAIVSAIRAASSNAVFGGNGNAMCRPLEPDVFIAAWSSFLSRIILIRFAIATTSLNGTSSPGSRSIVVESAKS